MSASVAQLLLDEGLDEATTRDLVDPIVAWFDGMSPGLAEALLPNLTATIVEARLEQLTRVVDSYKAANAGLAAAHVAAEARAEAALLIVEQGPFADRHAGKDAVDIIAAISRECVDNRAAVARVAAVEATPLVRLTRVSYDAPNGDSVWEHGYRAGVADASGMVSETLGLLASKSLRVRTALAAAPVPA